MQAYPRMTQATFHNLLLGTLSSWGNTSKNVMYRNVPPAIPCVVDDNINEVGMLCCYLEGCHCRCHEEDWRVGPPFRCQCQLRWDWRWRTWHWTGWSSWGWGRTGQCWDRGWRPSQLCGRWQQWRWISTVLNCPAVLWLFLKWICLIASYNSAAFTLTFKDWMKWECHKKHDASECGVLEHGVRHVRMMMTMTIIVMMNLTGHSTDDWVLVVLMIVVVVMMMSGLISLSSSWG